MKRSPKLIDGLHSQLLPEDAYYPEVSVTTKAHGTYQVEGRILTPDLNLPVSTMMIHGARADYTKADAIVLPLYAHNIPILNATTSGHGVVGHQSELNFSFDENLAEAEAFSALLSGSNLTLIGQSMGGTTAVRLVQNNPDKFSHLVLFYPTVFPDEVYKIPFGTDEFRAIASEKGAFLQSSFFDVIKDFSGKIMLIKGEFDGLNPFDFGKPEENSAFSVVLNGMEVYSPIPPEVFSRILELRPDTTFLEVKGADHRFAKWSVAHPKEAKYISSEIANFILR